MTIRSLLNNTIYLIGFFVLFLSSCHEEIPVIDINSNEELLWTHKTPCEVVIQRPDKKVKVYLAAAKYRGGMSASYEKHSLTVEFENKIKLGDIEKDDDWIFNASFIDKTFMRHKICSDLFLQMSSKNRAAHSTFVELNINQVFQGLYLAMEEINASNVGLDKSDTMAMLFKDPPIFFEERIPYPQDSSNYYQQKFPKIYDLDKTAYMEAFRNFLYQSSDEQFLAEVGQWVDINNVVDWHLWLLLTNNGDGVLKNFYMYKLNANTPIRFAVWDCDSTFGRDADNEPNRLERLVPIKRSILFKRLLEIEGSNYELLLAEKWKELRMEGVFDYNSFVSETKKIKKVIKPYLKKNQAVWPNDDARFYDDNDFKEELALMKEMYKLSLENLDERFAY